MTMTRLWLNEGEGSDSVGSVLSIKGSESLHRAPQGANIQEEGDGDQRHDPGERLGEYLDRRGDDLLCP